MFVIDGNGLARKRKKKKDKDRYKRLQTEVQYEIRKAGKKYMTDVIWDKDNTNKLWSYSKKGGSKFCYIFMYVVYLSFFP
jgi:hypothetical protein